MSKCLMSWLGFSPVPGIAPQRNGRRNRVAAAAVCPPVSGGRASGSSVIVPNRDLENRESTPIFVVTSSN